MPEFKIKVRPTRSKDAKPFDITISGGVHGTQEEAEEHVRKTCPNLTIIDSEETPAPAAVAKTPTVAAAAPAAVTAPAAALSK